MAESGSLTVYPQAYVLGTNLYTPSFSGASNPVGKGSGNTTYAEWGVSSIAYQDIMVYWPFDVSEIPDDAEIDYIECKAKMSVTESMSAAYIQMFSGDTAKGSALDFKSQTSASAKTLTPGVWTRGELGNVRLRFYTRGTKTAKVRFYGAELVVIYSRQGKRFMLRLGDDGINLPEGYTRLDFIKSGNGQYVDSGVSLSATSIPKLRVVADVEIAKTSGAWNVTGSGSTFPIVYFGVNGNGYIAYGDGTTDVVTTTAYTQGRKRWDYNLAGRTLSVDSTKVADISINASGSGSRNFYISAYATASGATAHEETIYRYMFYLDGVLVRNYIPCLNPSGVPGLYDIVNGVFYGSATSTPFVAGPEYNDVWHDIARTFKKVSGIWIEQTDLANVVDQSKRLVNGGEYVVELPEGYTRLEYIESTGSQYIDWGFKPNQDTRVVMDAQWTAVSTSENSTLFGSRKSASEQAYFWMYTTVPSARSGYNASYSYEWSIDPLVRRTVDKNKNTTIVDGETHSWTYANFQSDYNLTICALNNAGTIQWYASAKIWMAKAYAGDTMIRWCYPCKNASGVYGLYDVINDVFYPSASGTGFTGPEDSGDTPANIITFTIAGTTYKAESGMTFGQWASSSYNTAGYYFGSNGYLSNSAGTYVVVYSGYDTVSASTVIETNHAYDQIAYG